MLQIPIDWALATFVQGISRCFFCNTYIITLFTSLHVNSMTRSDLINALALRFRSLTESDAEIAVKEILDAITESLTQSNRVEIRGFGSFDVKYRPARTARNPKTGEKVSVPPKYVPRFKAGKEMRERVDQLSPPELIRLTA